MKKVRLVVVGILCISLIVGYYYFLSAKNQTTEEVQLTEVQKVILKDLAGKEYPKTPREVIKFYNRILCCLYNEEHTEEEVGQLADQILLLLDEELAANNPAEQFYTRVKGEIETYQQKEMTINNASVCDTNEVEFVTKDGAEYAYVDVSYFVKKKKSFVRSNQRYALRQDEEGHWKMLAFKLLAGEEEGF